MKNPLFRAYYEEIGGIAQGRFLKVRVYGSTLINHSGENQKFILVSTLRIVIIYSVVEQRGML